MNIPKDEQVLKFLKEQNDFYPEKHIIISKTRDIFFKIHPKITEEIKYGGILFSINNVNVGGVFPAKNHISIEFSKGYLFDDPNKLLLGSGKLRRHIKLESEIDIVTKNLEYFINQMKK